LRLQKWGDTPLEEEVTAEDEAEAKDTAVVAIVERLGVGPFGALPIWNVAITRRWDSRGTADEDAAVFAYVLRHGDTRRAGRARQAVIRLSTINMKTTRHLSTTGGKETESEDCLRYVLSPLRINRPEDRLVPS
jgi:hypothetical protein